MKNMRVFIARDFGRITGAFWAPENSGFDFPERAEASIDVRGVAKVYAWRDKVVVTSRGAKVVGREHDGDGLGEIQRGKDLAPEIRAELEDGIRAALIEDQKRTSRELMQCDEYGNTEDE